MHVLALAMSRVLVSIGGKRRYCSTSFQESTWPYVLLVKFLFSGFRRAVQGEEHDD